uniref:Endotype 6-aminohexanoat-oligomer hydrolase n=1 Tax=Borely moumouvirus TaxID=2712067 RepID=A0A6G6ACC5_9VIRU
MYIYKFLSLLLIMNKNKYLKYKTKYKSLKSRLQDENMDGGAITKQAIITNDNVQLTPKVSHSERFIEFDFPEISISSVEYPQGPTGCTYIRFNTNNVSYYVDSRGGSVMTYASNLSRSNNRAIRGICFAGGSFLGLEAVSGCVIEELKNTDYVCMSKCIVTGASLRSGNMNFNNIYPDKNLGRFAVQNAIENKIYLGQVGAGCMAGDGKYGQGAAFHNYNGVKIFVFTAVNALGSIYNSKGELLRDRKSIPVNVNVLDPKADKNTTLTAVITDLSLNVIELEQLAIQCHTNMASIIRPFHTIGDGDVLFGITLGKVNRETITNFNIRDFYNVCSKITNEAILSCYD